MTATVYANAGFIPDRISVSVVSHGQAGLVKSVLEDLKGLQSGPIEVIVTLNLEERLPFDPASFPFSVKVVRNSAPRGFGANHNAAFMLARGEFFCVANPDVRLPSDPFPVLLGELSGPRTGVAGPVVVNPGGGVEDSARRFPTPLALLRKALRPGVRLDYAVPGGAFSPDWIAGMFMMFRSEVFRELRGFDERYFLYYEDVDLCARLRLAGYDVRVNPGARVVHDARRTSHRDPRYLLRHLGSAARFFLSTTRREIARRPQRQPRS
jgi:GT2 family glycosyltransferase